MEETEFRARAGEASYSTLAHVINALCAPIPPVLRQNVYRWAELRAVNDYGIPFPEPARTIPEADRRQGQPSHFWRTAEVLDWYQCGVTAEEAGAKTERLAIESELTFRAGQE